MYSLILHPKREQSWHFGHPWIYSKAISKAPKCPPGALVSVYTSQNVCLGLGFFHPGQTIALRMLTRKEEVIDSQWFKQKIARLKNYREEHLKNSNAYRLCFGESDGIPGLVIDYYAGHFVLQINAKGIEQILPTLLEAIPGPIFFAPLSLSAKKEGVKEIANRESKIVEATENGLRVLVPLAAGQKTGWFCDQRDNRQIVRALAQGKSVLNLFSYSGGFSLAALAGGCGSCVSVDQDNEALSLFQEMKQRNGLKGKTAEIEADVWAYLNEERELFDMVIVDPPAFVKELSKKQEGMKGYLDLFKLALARVRPGGFFLAFSCSYFANEEDLEWILRQAFAYTGRWFQTVQKLGQGFDHPVPVWFKEAKYLKGFLLKEII